MLSTRSCAERHALAQPGERTCTSRAVREDAHCFAIHRGWVPSHQAKMERGRAPATRLKRGAELSSLVHAASREERGERALHEVLWLLRVRRAGAAAAVRANARASVREWPRQSTIASNASCTACEGRRTPPRPCCPVATLSSWGGVTPTASTGCAEVLERASHADVRASREGMHAAFQPWATRTSPCSASGSPPAGRPGAGPSASRALAQRV